MEPLVPARKTSAKRSTHVQRGCYACGQLGHLAKDCSNNTTSGSSSKKVSSSGSSKGEKVVKVEKRLRKDEKPLVVTIVEDVGIRQCPSEDFFCGTRGARKSGEYHGRRPEVRKTFCCKGFVEGQFVNDIVLDAGCSRTLVRSDLVRKNRLKSFVVQCACGDNVEYPVARIEIKVRGQGVTVEAAVSDKLPHSVLLRTDVPELVSLLKREDKALMAVTRSQAKRLKRSQSEQSREKRVDTSSASAEVVEKSIGGETLDCEKVVEESATSVGEGSRGVRQQRVYSSGRRG